jgi:ATP-dependent helicase/nuclease subunit A
MGKRDSSSDEPAREQFRSALDQNFCVVAGAGSGKTTAIVQRICELAIRDRSALRRLVVVTYTNSAAIEFKSRARRQLLSQVSRIEAFEFLRELEQTYFGTIHGFCLNLIREFRGRLGLPEQLRVPTENERDLLWENFVTSSEQVSMLVRHPVTHSLLRVCTLTNLLDVAKRFRPGGPLEPPVGKLPIPETKTISSFPVKKQSLKTKQRLVTDLEALVRRLSSESQFSLLPKCDSGPLKDLFGREMAPLITWLEAGAEWFANELARSFRDRCLQEGLLTYENQIDICLELLEQPDLLDELRRRELIVMVDEAQDTDTRMFRVFVELTRAPGEVFGSWPGTGRPPQPGRFCLVGDPRQTIFERGTLSRFGELCREFADGNGGRQIGFNMTYRCAETVVQKINELFADHEVEDVPLGDLAARVTAREGFVCQLPFTLEPPIDNEDELEPLVAESEAVAQWLSGLAAARLRKGRWNEIAIIAPRHDWLIIAADALKKYGVPYNFFRPKILRAGIPAFSWPIALIYTLVHPWDRFERYGVLREIFAVSDTDLLKAAKNLAEPGSVYREAEKQLDDARQELVLGKQTSLFNLLDRLLERFRVQERLTAVGEGFRGLDQLRWEAAKADESGATLEGWLETLLVWLNESAQPSKEPVKGVELITIHSAKGMEWEWVIPLGLGKKFSHRSERYPRIQAAEACQVVWSNVSRRAVRDPDEAENSIKRLLYVLLTRTKMGLILPTAEGDYRPGRQGKAFDEIVPRRGLQLPAVDDLDWSSRDETEIQVEPLETGEQIFIGRDAPQSLPAGPRLTRPSELVDDSPVLHLQFAEAAGAYDYGRWWHTWIELFPWAAGFDSWASYVRAALPPASYEMRARKELAALLENDSLREFCSGSDWTQAEFPFSWPKAPAEWYEGVIDLLIARPDGSLVVIDWKTNQAVEGENNETFAGRLRQTYLPQLESYRAALEAAARNGRIEIAIYSTVLGRFV